MELLFLGAGGVGAFSAGWLAAARQHWLYRQEAYRRAPAEGRKGVALRLGVALASAIVAALALRPNHYDPGPALLTAAFGIVLCVLASTDLERRILPNRLVYPALAAALVLGWAWPDRSYAEVLAGGAVALAAAGAVFALGLLAGGAGGLGLGDVKLAALIGLLTGWPAAGTALLLGILLAGVPALALILRGRGKSYFSYGPYLVLGGLAVLLFPGPFV